MVQLEGYFICIRKIKERRPPARLREVYVKSTTSEEWRTLYPWLEHVHLELTHIKTLELHIDFENAREMVIKEGFQAISNLIRGCSATLERRRHLYNNNSIYVNYVCCSMIL